MAMKPIIQSPDIENTRRDADTGRHLGTGPARGMVKRMPKGRTSSIIRRATGTRKLS